MFFGIPADSDILVTKDGFDPLQLNARLSTNFAPHRHSLTFTLNRKHARRDYSGVYVLDLVASCSGANPLPTPIQRRSYTATLSQRGGEATMTLSGADFEISERWGNGNVVQGLSPLIAPLTEADVVPLLCGRRRPTSPRCALRWQAGLSMHTLRRR